MPIIKKMQLLTSLDDCKAKYRAAKAAYYNGVKPLMTDAAFDKLEDHIRKHDPQWSELKKTGVKVGKKVEVALAQPMPSLNKAYPEQLPKWFEKNPARRYVVMEKLDGSSVQLTYEGGKPTKLVTRGDGTHGKDISFLIPYLALPTAKAGPKGVVVFRCEAVMRQRTFDKKWADDFENSRNLVNGLLNRQDAHPALKDVDIVVLGRYGVSLRDGFGHAVTMGLKTVNYVLIKTEEVTPTLLDTMRKSSMYDMDGLVVAPEDFELAYKSSDKPKGIVAFKVNDDEGAARVKVEEIVWQVTGNSRIVPKIKITPTRMDGVTVTNATAHNAQWMIDRGIGPGAIVRVLRSGGVIPKIVAVERRATKLSTPTIPHKLDGVHYVAVNKDKTTTAKVNSLRVVKFMKTLGIELIAGKTAATLAQRGLARPEDYIVQWGSGQLRTLIDMAFPGRQGEKIYGEISNVFKTPVPAAKLMVASQVFGVGIGERKLAAIQAAGISLDFSAKTLESLHTVPGFSGKTVQVIEEGLADWADFVAVARNAGRLRIEWSLPVRKKVTTGTLTGQKVSFTGYRDKEQEALVEARGGEIVSFGSKTTILLYKEGGKASSKVAKARADGRSVMTFDELVEHK